MVARGNWQPRTNSDANVLRLQPLIMGIRPQNMPQTSNSLLSPLNLWLLGATNGNQGQTVMQPWLL